MPIDRVIDHGEVFEVHRDDRVFWVSKGGRGGGVRPATPVGNKDFREVLAWEKAGGRTEAALVSDPPEPEPSTAELLEALKRKGILTDEDMKRR
jgi:hypothetical protein